MTRIVPPLAAVVLAALVALGAVVGVPFVVAALLLVTIAIATGWPNLLGLPTQRGSTTILSLCGTVAVLVVALTADSEPRLRWVPAVLALSVLAAFGHQLLRRDMRPRLVESITGVVSGVVVVDLASGWVAVTLSPDGDQLVLASAAAVAASSLATLVPWPQRYSGPLALAAGAVFAALAAKALPAVDSVPAAVLGLALGIVVASLDRLFTGLPTIRSRQAGLAVGAAVVASCGAVVYLASRALS